MGVGAGEDEGLELDLEISADIREAKSMAGGLGGGWWRLKELDGSR